METRVDQFLKVIQALNTEGVEYILVGGFAVVLHGSPRSTMDMDLMVRMNEQNIALLRKALDSVFGDECIEEITFSELDNYSVIRYGTPEDFFIDIMARIGEAFSIDNIRFERISVDGIEVKIATPESLYKMKEKTFRIVDQGDLLFLKYLMEKRHKND